VTVMSLPEGRDAVDRLAGCHRQQGAKEHRLRRRRYVELMSRHIPGRAGARAAAHLRQSSSEKGDVGLRRRCHGAVGHPKQRRDRQ
jgi:hypothetical protein